MKSWLVTILLLILALGITIELLILSQVYTYPKSPEVKFNVKTIPTNLLK